MVTVSDKAEKEGSLPAVPQEPASIAESRACARGIVAPTALTAFPPVTHRGRAAGQAVARVAEFLDRPGSLVHAQPPTFAQARERHHEAANRHGTTLFRHLRLVYGYFHLIVIKSSLNGLEWVSETPVLLLLAVIIGLVVWFFGVRS